MKMKILVRTIISILIALPFSAVSYAAKPSQVPAAELEKNPAAHKGETIALDHVSCTFVQGVYACFHETAKLFVVARVRPSTFQDYVDRGCGTSVSDPMRCMTAITFQLDDVRWEARPGQVRTVLIASNLNLTGSLPEATELQSQAEGALPIRANAFADLFNTLAIENGIVDLKASLTGCERGERSILCRYRLGEHSVLTMIAPGTSSHSTELALTSSIDTLARRQMVKTSMQIIIELVAPDEYPEVKVEALSALLRKAEDAQEHPRRPQLVSQKLGQYELLFYQDLDGQINFNVRKK
ncbi:hypothetical protein [Bradyrhizobium sp. URHA0013]|uniref:hypothetical protein n=1 Tax=Bradyrhizobium sp. URHA0013 TaxID=1380352 RepID=UPI0004872DD5|nr:hypothetical protein [Bradyrhizobium sp. URHA0013]